jgi:hypothetical protein
VFLGLSVFALGRRNVNQEQVTTIKQLVMQLLLLIWIASAREPELMVCDEGFGLRADSRIDIMDKCSYLLVRLILFGSLFIWINGSPGSSLIILDEPFDDLQSWADLSTATSWAGQPADGSAWRTDEGVLSLNEAGIASVGLRPWDSIEKSRSFTAIDHRFEEPISHRDGHLVIEFRVRWETIIRELRGEWNRINIMLVHDYPEDGIDLAPDEKAFDFTGEWWGRPSYQLRVRGSDAADGTALLMYGGGNHPEGEFEIYYDSDGLAPLWWLPGFSSTAGGANSEGGPSPGVGNPWPYNGWVRSTTGLASLEWQRFRYVVSPHSQTLYIDPDDDGQNWIRDGYFPLPEESEAPATAPVYQYFNYHEGIRVYFRGYENAYLDYLRAWYYPEASVGTVRIEQSEDRFHVRFHTEVGRLHGLEQSTDLINWRPVVEGIEGDGFEMSIDVTEELDGGPRFFRVLTASSPTR